MNSGLSFKEKNPFSGADSIEVVKNLFKSNDNIHQAESQLDDRVSAIIKGYLSNTDVADDVRISDIIQRFLSSEIPENPNTAKHYMQFLEEDVTPFSSRTSSPRCLGHMNQVLPYFVRPLAKLITAMNQNMTKTEASKAFTPIERQVLAMMHRLVFDAPVHFYDKHIQQPQSTLGVITSGGTVANISAIWAARNKALGPQGDFVGVEKAGLIEALLHYGYHGSIIIGSQLMHYSFDKAVGLLGLGEQSLIRIPTNPKGEMILQLLSQAIIQCQKNNQLIIAIVGLAGSTDCGTLDSLNDIASLAEKCASHFHVDAAWGGPLLFSETHKRQLEGIERADSVTIDGHKQFYLPLGIGMVLFRDPQYAETFEKNANYISRKNSIDLGKRSLEGSRPAMALYLHAAFQIIGRSGYASIIDQGIAQAQIMATMIRESNYFELIAEPSTNLVIYRYVPLRWRERVKQGNLTDKDHQAINQANEQLQKVQRQSDHSYVSRTSIRHTFYDTDTQIVVLRAVIANPLTTISDLEKVLEDQIRVIKIIGLENTTCHL